jgi:heptaprenyl diphosphate synthase
VYNNDFKILKERLQVKLQHPVLMQHIDMPDIDEEKLLLLYSILKSAKLHTKHIEHYAVAVMLVQIALDTHEKVSEMNVKKRQLTVLAGDYYSGLYYHLLADNHDISFIRTLAKAIEEVNEHKIYLHQHKASTVNEMIYSVQMIEASLIMKTCQHFQVTDWEEYAASFLGYARIAREYKQACNGESSVIFAAWKSLSGEKWEQEYHVYKQNAAMELIDSPIYAQWTAMTGHQL